MDNIPNTGKRRPAALLLPTAALAALFLFLATSDLAARAALRGLELCGKSLIPSLFPCLVLCGLLLRVGFPEWLAAAVGRPVGRILGISPSSVAAVPAGLLCGFPTGAAVAFGIRSRGLCTDRDCERTLCMSAFASPAFMIAGVGSGMLGSARLGLFLWLVQAAATLCAGLLMNGTERAAVPSDPICFPRKRHAPLAALAESIRVSADTTLGICGAVLFFSVLTGYLSSLSILPPILQCALACFLELTSGASLSARLLPDAAALIAIAAASGWSGLSVLAQTALVTGGELRLRRFLLSRLLSSLLAALFAAVAIKAGVV